MLACVFSNSAERGKGMMGWFYGSKLHLTINDKSGILAATVTVGNVDDRNPIAEITPKLWGGLYGDKGYISKKLTEKLAGNDINFATGVLKMKSKAMRVIISQC
ncbi:MAG: transposase [Gammaproteobacteria bacterium]|nr:transposase [Gammaproteobacteria bacterium]